MKFDSLLNQSMETVNHEGEKAYLLTHEMEIYTAVVTTELSDSFYENVDERINRINSLVSKVSPEFVAKLAVYARTKMQLRSVPLLLVVALARVHNGDDLVARTIERVVNRADEIMELLNCYALINGEDHSPAFIFSNRIFCSLVDNALSFDVSTPVISTLYNSIFPFLIFNMEILLNFYTLFCFKSYFSFNIIL